jgi:anti-sigma factor RsiW
MLCDDAETLLHLMFDGEVDSVHVRGVQAHVATCQRCGTQLRQYRALRSVMARTDLRYQAPRSLGVRIGATLSPTPARPRAATSAAALVRNWTWLTPFRGFALGAAMSAMVAAVAVVGIMRADGDAGREQALVSDVVSAYLRSLGSDHLADFESSDQASLGPWLASKLDSAPPVPDLSRDGISLVGGRLDYVRGRPVAALVYKRDGHVFNLFVAQGDNDGSDEGAARAASLQGVNVKLWSERGLKFCVVADVGADVLDDFQAKIRAAARTGQG